MPRGLSGLVPVQSTCISSPRFVIVTWSVTGSSKPSLWPVCV